MQCFENFGGKCPKFAPWLRAWSMAPAVCNLGQSFQSRLDLSGFDSTQPGNSFFTNRCLPSSALPKGVRKGGLG